VEKEERNKLLRIFISAGITLLALFLVPDGRIGWIIFLIPYLLAGYDVLREAVENVLHGELFDEEFLMTLATVGAFAIGEYPEGAMVMILYQLGELLQDLAVERSRKSVSDLMNLKPEKVTRLKDRQEECIEPEKAKIGDLLLIKPGERIALDGVVVSGKSSLNTAALTGENLPREIGVGENAESGSVNLTGELILRVSSVYEDSAVARILRLVEEAGEKKAETENFITRFSHFYTPAVVALALILGVIPPIWNGQWTFWLHKALVFLTVSCPCALVISVPLTFFCGIGGASKEGILVKGSGVFEKLAGVDRAIFDKTGTLTEGRFEVTDIHPNEIAEFELLDLAAAVENHSNHPIAQSVVRAHGGHWDKSRVSDLTEHAGMGMEAFLDGKKIYVGNEKLMILAGVEAKQCRIKGNVIHIARPGEYLGHIVIADRIKAHAGQAVRNLEKLGVESVMLTGDSADTAQRVAGELGMRAVYASLLPGQKVEKLEGIICDGYTTAFVGDGINDAPVIMRADVGFAMGALGSDAAVEAADVVLTDDDPQGLPKAIEIARRTMRIARENIVFALAVKLLIMAWGLFGEVSLGIAVFGDVGVAILATLNALRALKLQK